MKNASLAIKEQRYEDAVSLLTKSAQSDQFLFYFLRGLAYQRLNQPNAALSDYNQALVLKRNHAPTSFNRGIVYFAMGDWATSIADFTEAIRLGLNAHGARAMARTQLGETEYALEDIEEAISREPNQAAHFVTKSSILLRLDRNEEAIALLNHAISLDLRHAPAHNNLAWLLATSDDERIRDGKRALQHALKAIGDDSDPSPAYVGTLAAAYAEAGEFEKAVQWAKRFLENNPPEENKAAATLRLQLYEQNKPYREERGKHETVRDNRIKRRRS